MSAQGATKNLKLFFRNTSVNGGCRSPEFVSAPRCRPRRSRRSRKVWLSAPQMHNGIFTIFQKSRTTNGKAFAVVVIF